MLKCFRVFLCFFFVFCNRQRAWIEVILDNLSPLFQINFCLFFISHYWISHFSREPYHYLAILHFLNYFLLKKQKKTLNKSRWILYIAIYFFLCISMDPFSNIFLQCEINGRLIVISKLLIVILARARACSFLILFVSVIYFVYYLLIYFLSDW